ncbi:FAD-binding domain-containing protein [Xylariaceae sp. FL0016]|nr:FAD-binding domain-containing protein [Xylariaceae sp. FL0016]
MAADIPAKLNGLQQHITKHHSGLRLLDPAHPDFEAVNACFIKREAADAPCAIARPQNAAHVQALVKWCTEHGLDFVVRSGGHDCAGRSMVPGVLTVDMRDIRHVHVDGDGATATVDGGTLFRDLATELDARGLITPVGTVASVGYVGWATLGGYGPFSTSHGLGVDQIVGAKLVDHKGELVDADGGLLKGIRGGGGIFGIIVELTIKVYPLKELLVSLLVFESSDLTATWKSYTEGYEAMMTSGDAPRALQLQPFGIELPHLGKVLAISATWASADQEEGKKWFAKVATFGNCLMNNPEPRSVAAGSWGRAYTLNLRRYTPETAAVLAKHTALLPGGGIAMSLHSLRPSPDPSPSTSVFGARVAHVMLELIAMTPQRDMQALGDAWSSDLIRDLRARDPENIMDSAYVSLLADDESDYLRIYGVQNYEDLVALKRKYDPDNVFKYAVPRLGV